MMKTYRPKNAGSGVGSSRPKRTLGGNAAAPKTELTNYSRPRKYMLPPDRTGLCAGNDDTCGARRAKGTEYCIGHLRSIEKEVNDAAAGAEGSSSDAD